MGMASGSSAYDTSGLDFSFLGNNVPVPQQPEGKVKRRKRAGARQKTPEQIYAKLIAAGQVRIVRRKGKPPLIQWL